MTGNEAKIPISKNNIAIVKDEKKCIECGYCTKICSNEVTVARMYELGITKKPVCINCGQCANFCPTEALHERLDYLMVKKFLKKSKKVVTFSIAPAVRVALGEEFGLKPGLNVDKKIVTALKKIGASYVFDVTFGADLTIMEEAMELVTRIKEKKNLPMFTSCCPAWVKYAEIFYPELLPNLSTCKSPISMQGRIIKTYFASKVGIDPKNIINVAVAPCTAKKYEIKRKQLKKDDMFDTDFVITTRELALLLKEEKIDLCKLKEENFDFPLGSGSGAGVIFGNTGGVMEAALRTAYYFITGKDLENDKITFENARGMAGIKQLSIQINDVSIKVAIANGMKNAKKLIDKLLNKEVYYDFIEVMNCNGGCISGGGQPKITLLNVNTTRKNRIDGLYSEDEKSIKRVSYKNPDIITIYNEFLEKPLSNVAHEYLHTTYEDKSAILRGEKNKDE